MGVVLPRQRPVEGGNRCSGETNDLIGIEAHDYSCVAGCRKFWHNARVDVLREKQ